MDLDGLLTLCRRFQALGTTTQAHLFLARSGAVVPALSDATREQLTGFLTSAQLYASEEDAALHEALATMQALLTAEEEDAFQAHVDALEGLTD